MKETFHKRLRMARRMRGLSMDELVILMGGTISKQSISKYERGLTTPRPHHMSELMTALGITESYFKRKTARLTNLNYRSKGVISNLQKEHLADRIREMAERYLEIESVLNIYPKFGNPLSRAKVTTSSDIEKAAMQLREKWQLGIHPIPSIAYLLETYGIMVIEMEMDNNETLGFSAMINSIRPVVAINTKANNTTERKRFTMLHELAHILLFQKESTTGLETNEERLCERFASSMLCPAPVLKRELGERRTVFTLDELINIRESYGISIAAIVHSCRDTGIITEQYYNYVYDNYINKNKLEVGWGQYPIAERTNRFNRLIQRAVAEGIATQDELAELTGGNIITQNNPKYIWE